MKHTYVISCVESTLFDRFYFKVPYDIKDKSIVAAYVIENNTLTLYMNDESIVEIEGELIEDEACEYSLCQATFPFKVYFKTHDKHDEKDYDSSDCETDDECECDKQMEDDYFYITI